MIPVKDKNVSLNEFMNMTAVKAFKEIHNSELTGKWELQSIGDPLLPHDDVRTGKLRIILQDDFSLMV